jgi:NAD(P)-dependent dehydrogenase (short-subunit alcohol dehydrogenase family)
MELEGKVVCITGGARGIGAALARAFLEEGAKAVYAADLASAMGEARALADALGPRLVPVVCDVSSEAALQALIGKATGEQGRVDLFCSNAGIAVGGGVEQPDSVWSRAWEVNFMAHVWAVRAVLPQMLARGEGALLHTASAAGLLTSPGALPYSVTKHAVVALAEWLQITHGAQGIQVCCLCPQGVNTAMVREHEGEASIQAVLAAGAVLEPKQVAAEVVEALRARKFLVLPHKEVAHFEQTRAADRERWLGAMGKLWSRLRAGKE